jgi:hypothetical protein
MRKSSLMLVSVLCFLGLTLMLTLAAAPVLAAPTVRVMPDGVKTPTKNTAYAWAGNPLDVWGNATPDAISPSPLNYYSWDFGDGSSSGPTAVSDPRDIVENHTYISAGTYYATLTVYDTNGDSGFAQVRIDVLPAVDNQAGINLAIERGLKRLYLDQNPGGDWGSEPALGALSVLSFENRGHQPIGATTDIYHDTVVNGLNWLFTSLRYRGDGNSSNWTDVDPGGTGAILGQYSPSCSDESFYPHGMIMMALAAAGPYDKNYPVNDAVHNPALNLTVPLGVLVPNDTAGGSVDIGGWTYYQVQQYMMKFAAWAQADPGNRGRGGWRYCPNSDADNSVGQWPVIGLEAAEQWGIMAPAWVKSELKNNWLQNSYNAGVLGWGYDNQSLVDVAHAGAGLSMMAYVGIPKTDPWYQDALSGVAAHWSNQYYYTYEGYYWDWWPSHFGNTDAGQVKNYYAMYGIAKSMRIARDSGGNVSEVTQIGTHNWYDEYSAFLKRIQQADGSLPGWWYWGHPVSTALAILVLEPTVSSLRPVAAISASPNPVNANTTVNFNISGSTHQDPGKFLKSWKLIFDTSAGVNWSTPDVQGNFPTGLIPKTGGYPQKSPPASYDVTAIVQVTDNVGETSEATVIVHITTGLVAPVANPGGPYFGSVSFPITLNGCSSYDPNAGGSIVKYEWDLDGNGTYETNVGNSCTLQHTWTTPYTGQIGLRVTDNFGLVSTASVYTNITVADLKPVSYPLISYRRISVTVWEYTYKFTIKNQGNGDATGVSAVLQNWPAQVTVVDGNVTFPDVAAGAQVTSTDTFTIRINRSVPVQNSDLTWKLTYTTGGSTWVLVNFPLF